MLSVIYVLKCCERGGGGLILQLCSSISLTALCVAIFTKFNMLPTTLIVFINMCLQYLVAVLTHNTSGGLCVYYLLSELSNRWIYQVNSLVI